jgi:hypothetical protein
MRNICSTLTTALTLSIATPALAATSDGDFAVYGWGARDCNTIMAVLNGEQAAQAEAQLAEWISGFISAQNRAAEGLYDITPVKSLSPMVSLARNICANNSDELFENVVFTMLESFSALGLTENSPLVQLSHNGQTVSVNEETVRRVQKILIADGKLPTGSDDGQFGTQTALSIEAWQGEADITVNGLPDMVTLFLMAKQATQ